MKKQLVIFFAIICIVTFIIGCLNEKDNNTNPNEETTETYFNFYSSSSTIDDNVSIVIITKNITVFNDTLKLNKGEKIYQEIASGELYIIKIFWKGNLTEKEFLPTGYNSIFLIINNYEITFYEINID
ncbi:MAG: hypothetical protein MUC62_04295 [Candidatus Thermoplasmatota archaeon]|jgi:hypothetical protein|nr:hypothetical protein [Candidatus Thermoplasmatota archaeon]